MLTLCARVSPFPLGLFLAHHAFCARPIFLRPAADMVRRSRWNLSFPKPRVRHQTVQLPSSLFPVLSSTALAAPVSGALPLNPHRFRCVLNCEVRFVPHFTIFPLTPVKSVKEAHPHRLLQCPAK